MRLLCSLRQFSTAPKIVYFGSDDVAAPSLAALHAAFPSIEVVTHHTPPNIKQPNQVAEYCKKHSINCYQPIHKVAKAEQSQQWAEFNSKLVALRPWLGIVLSYGFMIPTSTIQAFYRGMIVVHPSLLPKYRGGAPIFHAILNGEKESGVSFIDISPKRFDQGNILYQTKVGLPPNYPYKEIYKLLAELAAKDIVYVANNVERLRPGKPQDNSETTSAPIIKDTKLQLDIPAERVYNMSRAIKQPRVVYSKGTYLILYLSPYTYEGEGYVGQILIVPTKKVFVRCKDKYIRLAAYKEPSRGKLPAWSFAEKYLKGVKPLELSDNFFN